MDREWHQRHRRRETPAGLRKRGVIIINGCPPQTFRQARCRFQANLMLNVDSAEKPHMVTAWIKEHRDQKLRQTMKTLKGKLQGTWNYYGLIGNFRRMQLL